MCKRCNRAQVQEETTAGKLSNLGRSVSMDLAIVASWRQFGPKKCLQASIGPDTAFSLDTAVEEQAPCTAICCIEQAHESNVKSICIPVTFTSPMHSFCADYAVSSHLHESQGQTALLTSTFQLNSPLLHFLPGLVYMIAVVEGV